MIGGYELLEEHLTAAQRLVARRFWPACEWCGRQHQPCTAPTARVTAGVVVELASRGHKIVRSSRAFRKWVRR